jgi:acyl-CoA thioester hydrolase
MLLMVGYHFFIPIQVRYGDIDAQWHVNNSNFLTYLEQARFEYMLHVGLWDGKSFLEVGLIVADVHLAYLAPIQLLQKIRVGIRVTKIGNKSMRFEYQIEDTETEAALANAETVMVAYDYHQKLSKPVPDEWRKKIAEFEGENFSL